jgi:hypothetical protein
VEPSSEEAAEALRTIERQRWQMRQRSAPPIWLGCAVFTAALVAVGLIEDLAAPSSGILVMSLFLACLVIGLAGRTRWGSALRFRRSLARPWIAGTGADGPTRTRIVVSVIWIVVAVAVAAGVVWSFDATATPVRSDLTLRNTVLNLGAAVVGSVLYVAYRRWLASKAGRR